MINYKKGYASCCTLDANSYLTNTGACAIT